MAKWVMCQNCHGNGKVLTWDSKKKTYVEMKCAACRGKGKVNSGLV